MFRIITKIDYWMALERFPEVKGAYGLKHVQDLFILSQLASASNTRICEAGGGNSRILAHLCKENECWNIDKLEGIGQGPCENKNDPHIKLVRAYLGDFPNEVPANYFDYLFSISVVEHVPLEKLTAFFSDCARILKPGGKMWHAIDLYLPDRDDLNESTTSVKRIRAYLSAIHELNATVQWQETPCITEYAYARACYATNTDLTLFSWNKTVPALKEVRAKTQSCSLIVGLSKHT